VPTAAPIHPVAGRTQCKEQVCLRLVGTTVLQRRPGLDGAPDNARAGQIGLPGDVVAGDQSLRATLQPRLANKSLYEGDLTMKKLTILGALCVIMGATVLPVHRPSIAHAAP
jgi:hypothetical protein